MAPWRNTNEPLTFASGEIIHEDEPYASCLSADVLNTVCSYCIARGSSVWCNDCGRISYCNGKCRKKDRILHELECDVLQNLDSDAEILDEETRLVIRCLDKYIRERENNTISEGVFFSCKRTFYDLLSHVEELSPRELETAKDKAKLILDAVSPFVTTHLEEVLDVLQRCRINCHSLVDHNDFHFFSRGRALYLAASKTNHSCVASSEYVQMFNGRKILLRAIQDIEIEDPLQLTIHYMPPTLPYKSRSVRCLNNYYFICSCRKCVWQARNPEPKEVEESIVAEIEQAFEEYHSFEDWYDIGLSFLEKLKDFPEQNFYVYWLLIQMQPTCFELGKYLESIEYGIRATNGAESILSLEPVFHCLCHAMVKLNWHRSTSPNFARFTETYKLTKTFYSITHGSGHEIIRDLRRIRGSWWKKGSDALQGLFKRGKPMKLKSAAGEQGETVDVE